MANLSLSELQPLAALQTALLLYTFVTSFCRLKLSIMAYPQQPPIPIVKRGFLRGGLQAYNVDAQHKQTYISLHWCHEDVVCDARVPYKDVELGEGDNRIGRFKFPKEKSGLKSVDFTASTLLQSAAVKTPERD